MKNKAENKDLLLEKEKTIESETIINSDSEYTDETIDEAECEIDEYEANYRRADVIDVSDKMLNDQFAAYLKQIAQYKVLPDEEIFDLSRKAHAGDSLAREKLFLHNLRLVVYIAKPYFKKIRTMNELDIIMEGNFGLWKAIDKFDPDKGFKFSTYAYHWVKQSIERAIMNVDGSIRLPVHVFEQIVKYSQCIDRYRQETGSESMPSKEYVQKLLGCDDAHYENMILAYEKINTDSLNRIISTEIDDSSEVIDFVVDETKNVETAIENEALANLIDELIEKFLTRSGSQQASYERNKDFLYRRFGLHGYHIHTLDEIGTLYGVTRERVRQIESKFIRYCRTGHARFLLKQFLE